MEEHEWRQRLRARALAEFIAAGSELHIAQADHARNPESAEAAHRLEFANAVEEAAFARMVRARTIKMWTHGAELRE